MSSLSNEQKQLLFDYCIGLTSEKESAEAEALISSSEEAAEIHSCLKAALSPLERAEFEPCPDELIDGTIWRVNSLADSGRLGLEHLLADEQTKAVTTKGSFWRNFGKMVAVAAVILLVAGVLIPSLNYARQKSWQQQCQKQLGSIFQGLSNYIADYDGQPPTVATATGAPWWKVGYQGSENQSNTRHIWLLVKGKYVEPVNFVCPGRSRGRALRLDTSQVQNFNDFPARRYITYSIRIRCPNSPKQCTFGQEPLMSDLNPLFENLPMDYSDSFNLRLNEELLTRNTINHNRRGQNVLFGDGGVKFTGRQVGADDIFTLQQMRPGFEVKGCERPSCESDNFLAP